LNVEEHEWDVVRKGCYLKEKDNPWDWRFRLYPTNIARPLELLKSIALWRPPSEVDIRLGKRVKGK